MLKQRIITASILAIVFGMSIIHLPAPLFSLFIGLVLLVAAWEWAGLAGISCTRNKIMYMAAIGITMASLSVSFIAQQGNPMWLQPLLFIAVLWWIVALVLVMNYPDKAQWWHQRWVRGLLGALVLIPPWLAISHLKFHPQGTGLIFFLIGIVIVMDTGAYFSGKAWGNKKLAPQVSPGKSWAGVYGGAIAALIYSVCVGLVQVYYQNSLSIWQWVLLILLTVVVGMVSVLGDLLESMLKRYQGVKDSSQLLPGHGGILDRFDSMTAAAPAYALAVLLMK